MSGSIRRQSDTKLVIALVMASPLAIAALKVLTSGDRVSTLRLGADHRRLRGRAGHGVCNRRVFVQSAES